MKCILLFLIPLCLLFPGCKDENSYGEATPGATSLEVELSGWEDLCPEWIGKELEYYMEKTPSAVPMLYYLETDSVPYFAITDSSALSVTDTLRLFDADGTEIAEEHKDYDVLKNLFLQGEFRDNQPCATKDLEIH
jgi:hypothetical protein